VLTQILAILCVDSKC